MDNVMSLSGRPLLWFALRRKSSSARRTYLKRQFRSLNQRNVRTNMTQTCPTAKELRSLVDGSLSDIDAQSIELHIERCEVCQHAIQELAADGTFWKSAAKNLSDDKIVGPGLDRVIETLQHQSREDAEEIGTADQGLRRLRPAVRLAQEVGAGLGRGALLLGPLPEGRGKGQGRDRR